MSQAQKRSYPPHLKKDLEPGFPCPVVLRDKAFGDCLCLKQGMMRWSKPEQIWLAQTMVGY